MIRRFGDPPQSRRAYRLRPGAYALLCDGDHLLLTRQENPGPDLQLPGGGIDPGESPIPALHREVYEETGWAMSNPRRIGSFRRFVYMPEYGFYAEKLCSIYLARPTRRHGPPVEPGHRALWMPVREAAQKLGNAGDRFFAGQLLRVSCRRSV